MNLKKCILTRNDCFTKGTKINKVTGIVVHSSGANNTTIKRYVQPLPTDGDYGTIMADIGTNIYNNHWNKSYKAGETDRQCCVHAFIGKNAAGEIETYQTLPFDICCWGVGSGSKGSYNYNPTARIQFEICEDALLNKTYFTAAFKEAAELCAYLCKEFNFTADQICSHAESYKAGYGGNHGDCDHWLKRFGRTMDDFRADVQALLGASTSGGTTASADLKIGDTVDFTGTVHYTSARAASGVACKPGKAKITAIYPNGTHPYHLVRVGGGGSTVYGWVNASDISGASAESTSTPVASVPAAPVTIKVGDKVKCNSGVTKFSNGANMASWVPKSTLYVRAIEKNGSIYLVSTEPIREVYTGRVNASDVYKI